jgi:hypothetical protein
MRDVQVTSIEELLKKDDFYAGYVFMRGVFFLALDDFQRAEEDIKNAFPYMLRALEHGPAVRVPGGYYELGAIQRKDMGEYLDLLGLIAGRKFSFEKGLDDTGRKRILEQWKRWWEEEGKTRKLNLGALKQRFATLRNTLAT